MDEVELVYSPERKSWNVFLNGEWYSENKDYDSALKVYQSFYIYEEGNNYDE